MKCPVVVGVLIDYVIDFLGYCILLPSDVVDHFGCNSTTRHSQDPLPSVLHDGHGDCCRYFFLELFCTKLAKLYNLLIALNKEM